MVVLKNTDVGVASQLWATLEVQGVPAKTDRGNTSTTRARSSFPSQGKCVRFTGGGPGGSSALDWGNCR